MDKEFYTITEVAKKYRIHPNTVRNAIKNGYLMAVRLNDKPNSHWRIPAGELERIGHWGLKQALDKQNQEENKNV